MSQVGMLRALLERGIVPDVVIGTSAGALLDSVSEMCRLVQRELRRSPGLVEKVQSSVTSVRSYLTTGGG